MPSTLSRPLPAHFLAPPRSLPPHSSLHVLSLVLSVPYRFVFYPSFLSLSLSFPPSLLPPSLPPSLSLSLSLSLCPLLMKLLRLNRSNLVRKKVSFQSCASRPYCQCGFLAGTQAGLPYPFYVYSVSRYACLLRGVVLRWFHAQHEPLNPGPSFTLQNSNHMPRLDCPSVSAETKCPKKLQACRTTFRVPSQELLLGSIAHRC